MKHAAGTFADTRLPGATPVPHTAFETPSSASDGRLSCAPEHGSLIQGAGYIGGRHI